MGERFGFELEIEAKLRESVRVMNTLPKFSLLCHVDDKKRGFLRFLVL
jgi:hypothetical protein